MYSLRETVFHCTFFLIFFPISTGLQNRLKNRAGQNTLDWHSLQYTRPPHVCAHVILVSSATATWLPVGVYLAVRLLWLPANYILE